MVSCSVNKHESVSEIDLSVGLNSPIDIKLSDIADTVELVFLENSESSLVGQILRIRASENYIIVLERSLQRALLYTRQGKFLSIIGSHGKGPGEYLQIIDASIGSDEKEIFLLCNGKTRATYIYDINGKLKSQIAHDFGPIGITSYGNSLVYHVGFPNSHFANQDNSIVIINEDLQELKLLDRGMSFTEYVPLQAFYISNVDNHISIWENYFDTIFYLNQSGEIIPRYTISHNSEYLFKNGPISAVDFQQKSVTSYYIHYLIDCSDYIFIKLSIKRKGECIIFEKATNHLHHVMDKTIINDIAGPKAFWPSGIIRDNWVYGKYDILALKNEPTMNRDEEYQWPEEHMKYRKHLDSLTYYDNPCIMLVKLKARISEY